MSSWLADYVEHFVSTYFNAIVNASSGFSTTWKFLQGYEDVVKCREYLNSDTFARINMLKQIYGYLRLGTNGDYCNTYDGALAAMICCVQDDDIMMLWIQKHFKPHYNTLFWAKQVIKNIVGD